MYRTKKKEKYSSSSKQDDRDQSNFTDDHYSHES